MLEPSKVERPSKGIGMLLEGSKMLWDVLEVQVGWGGGAVCSPGLGWKMVQNMTGVVSRQATSHLTSICCSIPTSPLEARTSFHLMARPANWQALNQQGIFILQARQECQGGPHSYALRKIGWK